MKDEAALHDLLDLTRQFAEALHAAGADDSAAVWLLYLPALAGEWRQFADDPALADLLLDLRYDLVARFGQEL